MNIKTQTIIDYSLFRKFFIFKKIRSKTFIFFLIFNVLMFTTIYLANQFGILNLVSTIILSVIQLLIISIYVIFNYYRLESTFKYEANKIGQIINYHFTDDNIKIYFETNKNETYALVKYEDLYKVYDFQHHLYIMNNKNVTYIITKGMYDGGSDLDLIDFLRKIIGLKYKKVRF